MHPTKSLRAAQVLVTSAEEAKRITGEVVPIDAAPGHEHRMAFTIRVPAVSCAVLASFNSPLNMVVHKVVLALAAGNTIVIKPLPGDAFQRYRSVESLLLQASPNHIQLCSGRGERRLAATWVENQEIAFILSPAVQRFGTYPREYRPASQRSRVGQGSIAATIVHEDADGAKARVANSASGAPTNPALLGPKTLCSRASCGGQVSPGRLLKAAIDKLQCGDPHDPKTIVGPMISEKEAIRTESWVREALEQGATLVHGNRREGALFYPTVRTDMRVMCRRRFLPWSFRSFLIAISTR